MRECKNTWILGGTLLFCLVNTGLGWWMLNPLLSAAGGIGLCYVALRIALGAWRSRIAACNPQDAAEVPATPPPRKPVDPTDTDGLIEQMLEQGRCTLLLRSQIADTLSNDQFRAALSALEETMALVPDGEVVLGRIDASLDDGRLDDNEIVSARGRVIRVERFFLDRYPVTNRQFYEFVISGGYEQMPLWDESIWTAVLDLVDRTGQPGPYYWKNGCYLHGQENHPVVGISWYEAVAYSRWAGKRLPTDAEWVKSGSWPVPLSPTSRVQRKFPWGDSMLENRANLWSVGVGGIVSVDEFPKGVSVGGVYQLIGNVWEWTAGAYRSEDHPNEDVVLPIPMKNIRGGAFDTYFDNQATCQFQSGENPLGRRHNIGFRCAVGVCDLTLTGGNSATEEPADTLPPVDTETPSTEEVPV
ncbi:MAG: formylglycine-generating enzyme family protein [Candidatus Nealsonbacteria bacterium]|nr:formylglycine-generating enzyme family protein [Candidatus Nealsonbacteria bacterium]